MRVLGSDMHLNLKKIGLNPVLREMFDFYYS